MRCLSTATLVALLAAAPAFGQGTVTTPDPFGLDPYKPSDAVWLRDYGPALIAQTPLLELRVLDPYKPSDAALLRQVGAAMPLCCPNWFPGPAYGPFMPPYQTAPLFGTGFPTPVPGSQVVWMPPIDDEGLGAAVLPGATAVSSLNRPSNNDGIWLSFAGQTWISAGRAVSQGSLNLQRVGDYDGVAVYKRAAGADDVIYVPAREGMVAPYRLKP